MTRKSQLPALVVSLACTCSVAFAQGGTDNSKHNEMAQHVNRGVSLMRARQYDAAMSEFEAAKAMDPKNTTIKLNIAECHNNKGVALYRQHAYAEAVVEFEHCLEVMPSHSQARHNINLCRQRMEIEGIPDSPPAADEKAAGADGGSGEKKKAKETADTDKKEDSSPKVSGGGAGSAPELTVSAGGAKLYSTGTLYPQYTDTPSAVTVKTVQFAPPAGPKKNANPSSTSVNNANAAAATASANAMSAATPNEHLANNTAGSGTASADNSGGGKTNAIPFTGDAFDPNSTPGLAGQSATATPADPAPAIPAPPPVSKMPTVDNNITAESSASFGTNLINATNATLPAPSNYTPTVDGLTLDEKVGALELKVYGKKNAKLPIMKRIEQLETDYVGQTRQGPMNERVEFLKRAIGHGQ